MKAPHETARQASAREAREDEQEARAEEARAFHAESTRRFAVPKPAEPRKPREPANLTEEWANLNYVINVYLETKSDETLGKLKEQLKTFDERVRK